MLRLNVLLLADVFITYRKKMHKIHGLDPLYCISAPVFSNRAMLKMTNIEIKLITSIDMHLMIENGMRRGRCEPIYYHAEASSKYVNPNFDKNKEKESYTISLEANSLYASANCYKLPYGKPKFDHNISKYAPEYIFNLDPNGDCCYIYVVDIHYRQKITR